jgi:dihydroneopterin aldolase
VQANNTYGWMRIDGMLIEGARVGIHPHEKDLRQSLEISVGFWLPTAAAAQSDTLAATVDWSAVLNAVQQTVHQRHYGLIETLCEHLAAILLKQFPAGRLQLRIAKVGCLATGRASVEIERTP